MSNKVPVSVSVLKKNSNTAVPDKLIPADAWSLDALIWVVSGSQGSRASLSSPISCSQSDMFAELEAAAPQSASCPSLDHADDSDTEITSPTTGKLVPNIGSRSIHYHKLTLSTRLPQVDLSKSALHHLLIYHRWDYPNHRHSFTSSPTGKLTTTQTSLHHHLTYHK